jgi:hypothetical protein
MPKDMRLRFSLSTTNDVVLLLDSVRLAVRCVFRSILLPRLSLRSDSVLLYRTSAATPI